MYRQTDKPSQIQCDNSTLTFGEINYFGSKMEIQNILIFISKLYNGNTEF